MEIKYTIEKCSLGLVIIGLSEKGICFLTFGDSEEELVEELENTFKKAKIVRIDKKDNTINRIIKYIENPVIQENFKLEIHGTDFQKRVWNELIKIPPGSTISYKELANRVGKPFAVRAVANACGANKIAVIIPCHRVIRSDGFLGGYSSGLWRKKLLLQREGLNF